MSAKAPAGSANRNIGSVDAACTMVTRRGLGLRPVISQPEAALYIQLPVLATTVALQRTVKPSSEWAPWRSPVLDLRRFCVYGAAHGKSLIPSCCARLITSERRKSFKRAGTAFLLAQSMQHRLNPSSIIPRDRPILGCDVVAEIEKYLVDIAPTPALGRIVTLDDGMARAMKMRGRMAVGEELQQPA